MRVLIVDDTKALRAVLHVYLMGWGLEFVEAPDGAAALARARAMKPDLVISDVNMPGMDGFELCAAIRADAALHATPVVLLTALKDQLSRQKGRLVGATAFLTKPVAVEELRATVSGVLGLPAQGRAS